MKGKTDLRYTKELLGHNSSKIIERDTHVTKKSIYDIQSPLDRWMRYVRGVGMVMVFYRYMHKFMTG